MKIILILIVFSLLLSSCGFKRVNQDNKLIYIKNFEVDGAQEFTNSLKNNILIISNKNSENKYDIRVKIQKVKTTKSKDITGKITKYNLTLTVNFFMTDLDNNEKIQKVFEKSENYNVANKHSDTLNNEKNLKESIIQRISDDIINFIILRMRNQ